MTNTALYPGTFDPITNGHLDIIRRALGQYDKLIVAISAHSKKAPLFSVEDRLSMVQEAVAGVGNITVVTFDNLIADFAKAQGVQAIIRGLRVNSDFEYEFTMAQFVSKQAPEIELVYLMAGGDNLHISSSAVREIAALGGDVVEYVPAHVDQKLQETNT